MILSTIKPDILQALTKLCQVFEAPLVKYSITTLNDDVNHRHYSTADKKVEAEELVKKINEICTSY